MISAQTNKELQQQLIVEFMSMPNKAVSISKQQIRIFINHEIVEQHYGECET